MPMRCRISGLALLLATTTLVHGVAAQQQLAAATIEPAVNVRPADDIITPGQIMLRRTEAALSPATQTSWEEKLKQQMAQAQKDLEAANAEQLAKMRDDNSRLQQQLTAQQLLVTESSRARDEATQAKLQAAQATLDAQTQAANARLAALAETVDARGSVAEARVRAIADTTTARLNAQNRLDDVRYAALENATDTKLTAQTQTTNLKLAALAQITDTASKLNDARIAALSSDIEHKLNYYATQQLARVEGETKLAMADIAKNARMDVLALQTQTANKLAEIREQANEKAATLAAARASEMETKLNAAMEQRTSPDDVKQLARQQLAEAQPEMRALALQTLSDSQDYIKTVARDAVKDEDPALQEALQKAARNVITKDNKVVFAMRKAMARQIAAENAAGVGAPVPNYGEEIEPGAGPDTASEPQADMRTAQGLLGNDIDANTANLQITAPAASGTATAPQVLASLATPHTSLLPARNRRDWVDLRQYRVVVHEDGKTLEELLGTVLKRAEPFTGPWRIKWKISPENRDIITTRFSLDTETTFDQFVSYLAQYLVNDRGVKVTFSMFDRDRILIVSD
ncbi:MAG TPA: hypothetical protein VHP58_02935 [Alphaproteobacteria bacterium]|nr:hypothetical protein [Alphaproteobacteria bacterium]